ncbi:hypothetical protein AB7196_14765 [Providencia rettgeri]|nr:hypothetical protein [Escherichia coli]
MMEALLIVLVLIIIEKIDDMKYRHKSSLGYHPNRKLTGKIKPPPKNP